MGHKHGSLCAGLKRKLKNTTATICHISCWGKKKVKLQKTVELISNATIVTLIFISVIRGLIYTYMYIYGLYVYLISLFYICVCMYVYVYIRKHICI